MQQTPGDAGHGRTVVVVEDNDRSRRLACDLLELHGFEVIGVATAEEGLELVRTEAPALLLLDIQLPGMDGVAALKALRADAGLDKVPVVAVTAYAMRGDEERLLAEGFDAYIAKPIDTRAFIPRLLAVLAAHGR
jgi:two-component system cell cycle response regulator DivK